MKIISALLIITLIPLIYTLIVPITDMYLFIGLFTIEFIIIGLVSTIILYPSASLTQITKKPIQIIVLGIAFSLVAALITKKILNPTLNNLIIVVSVINIILIILSIIRQKRAKENKDIEINKRIEKYSIAESTYAILIYCLICYVGMNVPPFSIIPLWFGLCIPFIAFLPGYLIINTLLPKQHDLEVIERLGIALFLSLVIMSIFGLIYNSFYHVINMRHVALYLDLLTVILVLIYIFRTKNIEINKRFKDDKIDKAFIIISIVSLVIVILSGIYINADAMTQPTQQGNTTFTINGISSSADEEGYYHFESGEELSLNMSITNKENQDVNYIITIQTQNDTGTNEVSNITQEVKDGETVEIPTNLTMTSGKKDIVFTLYKDQSQAYKIRHLYVDVE